MNIYVSKKKNNSLNSNSNKDMCESSNYMAQQLFKIMEKNSVVSPLSIAYMLSLIHQGAVKNTEMQLTICLGMKNTVEELMNMSKLFNYDIIKLANVIIVNKDKPVKKEYLEMMNKLALVINEDFDDNVSVVKKANDFIEKNTNGMIKNILQPDDIDSSVIMILLNTIYFKATWEKQFNGKNIKKESFNGTIMLDMMSQTKFLPYHEDEIVQVLEKPYVDSNFVMGFVLSKKQMNLQELFTYCMKCEKQYVYTEVHIPKFTHRKKMDMVPLMKQLNVFDMFDSEKAKFSNMTNLSNTFVSKMIHEAVIIVDETGTEAAAATTVTFKNECMRIKPEPKIFYANRPFVYYIKHLPTNIILFVGDFHGV